MTDQSASSVSSDQEGIRGLARYGEFFSRFKLLGQNAVTVLLRQVPAVTEHDDVMVKVVEFEVFQVLSS